MSIRHGQIPPRDAVAALLGGPRGTTSNDSARELSDAHVERIIEESRNLSSVVGRDWIAVIAGFAGVVRDGRIALGPGRGGSVGLCMLWALGLTDVDPLKHRLR
jgi:DNA polymerase III alpha subunit